MAKLLLVEDDRDLALAIETELKLQHHTVEVLFDGLDADEALKSTIYDAVILDWNLPRMTGIEILSRYRQAGGRTPIIMLTAKDHVLEKAHGLDSGADDYLTKPFNTIELSARIRSLLRRPPAMAATTLQFEDIFLDPQNFRLTKNGSEIRLLPRDFALLEFFLRHPQETFSVDALMSRVWHYDSDCSPGGVRMAITRIRKALDTEDGDSIIENVTRVGYRLRQSRSG